MKNENTVSISFWSHVSIHLSHIVRVACFLVLLISSGNYFLISAQNDGVIFELGYNINSTFMQREPDNSPLTILQDREALNGLHLAIGQRQPLSSLFKIEYALNLDLLGFVALQEEDRHKQSNLGVRLLLQADLIEKLSIAVGGIGYFKAWGDALDEKSIFFDPFLKQKSYFFTATARVSYQVLNPIDAFVSYHYNFTPLYTYDFKANQFPLDLKLYYRFLQVGVAYRISAKPDRLIIQ